jgi:hypothetical protein
VRLMSTAAHKVKATPFFLRRKRTNAPTVGGATQ